MEKDPAQAPPQQDTLSAAPVTATAVTAQDSMPVQPPPPFTVTASGPGGVERSGGDTLSPAAQTGVLSAPPFKVEASTTTPAAPTAPRPPAYAPANAILGELSTSGASLESARQDDRTATQGGPDVSARMARTDQQRILKYVAAFITVGEETGLPPALLAAIASRESRGGKHLDANGYGLSDPDGYGIMQVDIGSHTVADQGGPGSLAHIRQAADVLSGMLDAVREKFPDWTPPMQLRGAVAAYNFNVDDVRTWDGLDRGSAHHDYSADIWERARYYAALPEFGGDGAVVEAAAKAAPAGRPALRKGRLIAEPVGAGGVNHAEDVARVLARLQALKVITAAEAADPDAVATYITRYQALVNDGAPDGLMEPGRKTEDRLIAGTLTRAAKPKADKKPKEKSSPRQGKAPGEAEEKALAEYRRILKETPATEAGAEDILARGDTFAANAFADLARMGRYDLLAALKEEVGWLDRDWMARCIAGRLSDAELSGLPRAFLAGLHTELDAGITLSDEYALMDKLDKAMGKTAAGKGRESKQSGGKAGTPKGGADSPKQPRSTRGIYVVSAADAFLRDDKLEVLPGKVLPRWADVTVTQEKTQGGKTYAYAKATDGSIEGWTAKSNLYSLDWSAKAHEAEYRGHCDGYYDMMAANDPEATRKDLVKSGTGAKAVIDRYYPNYTSPDGLFVGKGDFRQDAKDMLSFWEANGISYEIESAVRHPLRSVVFNYAVDIAKNGSADKVEEANAVCRKYGIPIDWAHRKGDGTIDTAKSASQARLVANEFGLVGIAAKGVTDFGGTVSNHNKGQALDVRLTFTKKVSIEYDGVTYEISPQKEIGSKIPDVANTPLSLLCKKKFQITRALPNDAIHWSATGR